MNNFLLWIGGLVTLCLGLLFAVPHFIDWNGYRGLIEDEASRVFGRDVRVGGEVNVRILPVPYVSFDKLSISDTDEASSAPIIRAENFKMWLSVPPLLQGVMEAHHVELNRPVIELMPDGRGGGNWQSLKLHTGKMAFVPGGFALEALDMVDGQVIIRTDTGSELTRVERINGRLSAPAVEGPYKFNGRFTWQQQERSLRLATARPASDGSVRLKASIASGNDAHRFILDGAVGARHGKTSFNGNVTAELSGLSAGPDVVAGDINNKTQPAAPLQAGFDLKAGLYADTTAMRLKDINLALKTDGAPQLMTGYADLKWAQSTALNVVLTSRWIDIDRFTARSTAGVPLDNARQLLVALGRALPQQADTNVRVAFDQATLGGEALGAIQLEAVRRSGPLRLKEFEAKVPGGGRIAMSGTLSVSKKKPGFEGQITADGKSLLRVLRWGLGDDQLGSELKDGPFALDGGLRLSEQSFELFDATADFGAAPLQGSLKVGLGSKRDIFLSLSGNTIEWNRLSPEPLNVGLARKLMRRADGHSESADVSQAGNSDHTSWSGLANRTDLQISLKATKLVDGEHVFRDFNGQLQVKAGKLEMPMLKFTRDSGLSVDVGLTPRSVTTADGTVERGEISGLIAAGSHVGVADLLHFLDAKDLDPAIRQRLAALAPARVATVIKLAGAGAPETEMQFDGVSQGGRIVANVRFSEGFDHWRTKPANVTATIINPSEHRLLSLISDSRMFSKSAPRTPGVSQLAFKATGVPAEGMLTRAVIDSDGLAFDYYGDFALAAGAPFSFDGEVNLNTNRTRQTLALLGIDVAGAVEDVAMRGRFRVARQDATLRVVAEDVTVDGTNLRGLIALTEQSNAPSKVVANLEVDDATLPGMLRMILAGEPERAGLSEANALAGSDDIAAVSEAVLPAAANTNANANDVATTSAEWPKAHFDLSPLTNVEGYVTAKFNSFSFGGDGDLTLKDANLEASVAPGKISVTTLKGTALGGTTTLNFDLEKAPAGVDLKGRLKLQIGASTSTGNAKPSDDSTDRSKVETRQENKSYATVFELSYQGRAFAPHGLASDLDGEGSLKLANASLTGLTAKEVREETIRTLEAQGPVDSKAFVAGLREKMKQGQIDLGSLTIPVELKDGSVSVADIEIAGAEGRTTFSSNLEIASMKFDSEWKIEAADPRVAADNKKKVAYLPPVTVVYVGALSDLTSVEPRLATGALEREVAVRKMERDVSELERLRKLDEAKAKEEAERRRALERSLAEQRRQQAEWERNQRLLIEQQGGGQSSGGLSETPAGSDAAGATAQAPAEAQPQEPPPQRRRRPRKPPPPPRDVFNPFQVTPY